VPGAKVSWLFFSKKNCFFFSQSAASKSQQGVETEGAINAAVSGPMVNTPARLVRTWFGTAHDPALPGVSPGTMTSPALMVVKKVL
jgi:hypothetical protein